MSVEEWRLLLLILLAWELRGLQRTTYTVITTYGDPVLLVPDGSRGQLKIRAGHADGRWFYTIDRGQRFEAGPRAAHEIASVVTA